MNKTTKTPRLVLRKEHLRTLAMTELVLVAGGDLTTVSRETQAIPHDVHPRILPGTGCD
jgi:hypothetical protein